MSFNSAHVSCNELEVSLPNISYGGTQRHQNGNRALLALYRVGPALCCSFKFLDHSVASLMCSNLNIQSLVEVCFSIKMLLSELDIISVLISS